LIRDTYLRAAAVAVELVARPEVATRWDEPSILPRLTVKGLASHLARAVLQVEWFLDAPVSDQEPMDAVQYFAELQNTDDLDSTMNVTVRRRAEETAAAGWASLLDNVRGTLGRLQTRLSQERQDRRIEAWGRVLLLDEYLRSRLIELSIHADDLALSVDVPTPDLGEDAVATAVGTLFDVAIARHGRFAVLRALTRRERDEIAALRVL
jgi:hypothetical protein